jgi:hypothetical protein
MVDNGAFERLVVTYCVLEHLPLEFAERMGKSANAETEVTVTLKGQNPENKLILTLSGKHLPQQYIYISGYFSQNGAGEATSGAYGSNPEVAKFLEKMYNPMGINPRF